MSSRRDSFENAAHRQRVSYLMEFYAFLAMNKKWWLLPILLVLLLTSCMVILGSTGAAPFIYTLF